jgi:hypothetical protein
MALTYTELTTLVRNWSNRDEEVVSDAIIQDALKYAADKAYRTLRIPPLENVAVYEKTLLEDGTTGATSTHQSRTEIKVPFDLIEIIQIKELDSTGLPTRVWNEKVDVRTFNDPGAEKYTGNNYFTREKNVLILAPGFGENTLGNPANSIELLYYRRLPALNAKYAVTNLNYNAGFLTTTGGTTALYFVNGNTTTSYETLAAAETADTGKVTALVNGSPSSTTTIPLDGHSGTIVNGMQISGTGITGVPTVSNASNQSSITISAAQTLTDNTTLTFSNTNTANYIGTDVPNWLRDQNERVLLYGSLSEIFAFVQDEEQSGKYLAMFNNEIAQLNDEDAKRNASGGNIQVNFNGRGLI